MRFGTKRCGKRKDETTTAPAFGVAVTPAAGSGRETGVDVVVVGGVAEPLGRRAEEVGTTDVVGASRGDGVHVVLDEASRRTGIHDGASVDRPGVEGPALWMVAGPGGAEDQQRVPGAQNADRGTMAAGDRQQRGEDGVVDLTRPDVGSRRRGEVDPVGGEHLPG